MALQRVAKRVSVLNSLEIHLKRPVQRINRKQGVILDVFGDENS